MRGLPTAAPLVALSLCVTLASCVERPTEPPLGLLQVRNLRADTVGFIARNREDAMQYISIGDTLPASFLAARTLVPGGTTLVPLDEVRDFRLQTHVRLLVYRVRGSRAEYQTSVDAPGLALQQMRFQLDIPAPFE
jgi:hypothetical protein